MLDENLVAELVTRGVISDTFRRLPSGKKNQIYQAAISLFGKYGYDGLSVDRLCPIAGISKGSFFQYFPSKSHLLEFVILAFDDYLAAWIAEIRRQETSVLARDRLRYLYHTLVVNSRLFETEQRFYLFVTSALNHAGVEIEGIDLERHIRDYVCEIVERGEQTGEIRGDFQVQLTGYLAATIIEAMVRRQFSGQRTGQHQTEEYLTSLLFDGMSA